MLKPTIALTSVALVAGITSVAQAQTRDFRPQFRQMARMMQCQDHNGQPVLTLLNPMIGRAALLDKTSKGRSIIVVNMKYLKTPHIMVFAFYRKCASIALRHPPRRTVQHEAQADCWAIQTMARRRLLTVKDARIILKSVYRFSGQARGNYALRCAKQYARFLNR